MSHELPNSPTLDHLRKQAKRLLRDYTDGNPAAVAVLIAATPGSRKPKLSDAQHVVARQYGFANWAALKHHVESLSSAEPAGALAAAVLLNDATRVRDVLDRFPMLRNHLDDPVEEGDFGATPLIVAANQRNRAMIDVLLDAGANVNQRSHWWAGGFGVLGDDAALNAHLMSRGATVDAYDAARLGLFEQLKMLVRADPAAVHARFGDGQTALHVAASVEIASFLLDNGAEVDAADVDHESTPAQYLIRKHQDVVRLLISRGARTDVLMACALGDADLVTNYLEADPDCIWTTVSPRYFPMQNPRAGGSIYIWTLGNLKGVHAIAKEFGHEELLPLLLSRTPDILALSVACEANDEMEVTRLRARLPRSLSGMSPEVIARLPAVANTDNGRAVQLMLDAGWPADSRNYNGETALHWSAFHGNLPVTRELIARGADVNAKERTFDGSPRGWAEHGMNHSWRRANGDYPGVLAAIEMAGGV